MSPTIASHVTTAVTALERVPRSPHDFAALSDAALLALSTSASTMQRLVSTHSALITGEIARRSTRELGSAGLAQRSGYRTPEELVRVTTGSTGREAAQAVRIGALAHDAVSAAPTQPWLHSVSAGLVAGTLSIAAADAIRNGLGSPTVGFPGDGTGTGTGVSADGLSDADSAVGAPVGGVTVAALAAAATQLCAEAATLDADRLYRRARQLRDELDEAGIADREAARHQQRTLRYTRLPDGMARLSWMLDPETAATVGDLYDRATSPRRGGPRFVSGDNRALADAVLADTRSTEQLASDVFAELLRHGADADSTHLLGTGAPVVRVIATRTAVESRTGHGWLEGHPDPISIETVERLACGGAVQEVIVGAAGQTHAKQPLGSETRSGYSVAGQPLDAQPLAGQPLDLGREQRLFSRRQRDALALRDGGCRWPGCERPPSWTEAHHTQHWARDHGTTDLNNGVLLCRHHHLLLHNNHWEIQRDGPDFWLIPPPDIDPKHERRPMPSKSPAMRELAHA